MGVEPFLVGNSLNLVAAQRLVRRVCKSCTAPFDMPVAQLVEAGFTPEVAETVTVVRGKGCDRCSGTGYRGRLGLFEVMEVSEGLTDMIAANASTAEIRRLAIKEGMLTLRQSGLEKVRQGVTTVEEVVRETM
jgi:type IV pilus assembly protein PilB